MKSVGGRMQDVGCRIHEGTRGGNSTKSVDMRRLEIIVVLNARGEHKPQSHEK